VKRDGEPSARLKARLSIAPDGGLNFEGRHTLAITKVWLLSIYNIYVT